MNGFRIHPQAALNFDELVIDNFAGGGGASTGIEQAIGRPVDIAINHDPDAIRMHETNHPHTRHYCESVWEVDPREVTGGQPVGLVWLSPDCKHFSKAKGGKPVEKAIRGLAWVALRWMATVRPRLVMLENVEEFVTWGPLVDGRPCPRHKGREFRVFINAMRKHGYRVEWRELQARDYGAPTIRKRLFLIARCDGLPIVWPEPTHGHPESDAVKAGHLQPWRTMDACIDWSLPCPSIFLTKEEGRALGVRRPLAENTMRRIARGVQKFVVDNPEPFLISYYGPKKPGEFRGRGLTDQLPTQTTENRFALVTAFLAKHYGGNYTGAGLELTSPISTITATDHHALVTSHLIKFRGTCQHGQPVTEPGPTVTAGGWHVGEVRAFITKFYGASTGLRCGEPLHTIPTRDRFGLVTVHGELHQIVDIGMRMLEPNELFAAQGFPADYIIDRDHTGRAFTKTAQVARCGNSVSPPCARALVAANYQNSDAGIGEVAA